MSALKFTADRMDRFQKVVAQYETRRSALLPVLYLAQEQFGFLSPQAMDYVAELLQIPPAHVYEAVSFYVLFKKKDMGKFCLQVCNNVTCHMRGAEKLLEVVKQDLGIGPFEVTQDGMFSLLPVQCLGSCDTGPVVQVNEEYVENLDPEKFRGLLQGLRAGKTSMLEEAVT